MFVTNWNSTTKIQKISEITNFFRHYFLSRTEVVIVHFLAFTIKFPRKIIIFFIPYYILKGLYFIFLVPRFFLFYRFPITIAKIRRLFLSAKYPNLACMKCHSECIKWQRGGAISLNYSWRITVDLRMHITCCASAHQLLYKRTTAVVRPEILTISKTYTIFSNNLYYVFQQHFSNIPTNKKWWIINLWARPAPYQLLVSAKFAKFAANI